MHSTVVGCFFVCQNLLMTILEKRREFTKILFRWHQTHYRDMPWRRTHDPYRILVSEIMLQQTQVERVRTKYSEFLKQFPNVHALAEASLGDVLCAWSGLGYNRRARYLYECAKHVVGKYRGKFPDDCYELKQLPGIGLSTAAALLAFSFGKDAPMIDTNIRRILVRVFFRNKKQSIPSDKELYIFAQGLIPKGKGRAWNYAMLDLGAILCTARNHSDECPLIKLHGAVGDFQYKKSQKKFAGSRRQVRGQILRSLTEHKGTTLTALAQELGKTKKEIIQIVSDLMRERLVSFARGKVMLPG